jgi:hypothetical protein
MKMASSLVEHRRCDSYKVTAQLTTSSCLYLTGPSLPMLSPGARCTIHGSVFAASLWNSAWLSLNSISTKNTLPLPFPKLCTSCMNGICLHQLTQRSSNAWCLCLHLYTDAHCMKAQTEEQRHGSGASAYRTTGPTFARSPNCFLSCLSPRDDLSWRWAALRKKIREYGRRFPTAYRSNNCGLKCSTPSAERLDSA